MPHIPSHISFLLIRCQPHISLDDDGWDVDDGDDDDQDDDLLLRSHISLLSSIKEGKMETWEADVSVSDWGMCVGYKRKRGI